MSAPDASRYSAVALQASARSLLVAAGLPPDRAEDVADVLLEGDLLGHTTHGLALLGPYLGEIAAGRMPAAGEPAVVADHGCAITWDGGYLPGPWLVRKAISAARVRLAQHPMATIVIGRCHHIACLQAYLQPVTDSGLFVLLTCTDPANKWVAPPGAVEPVYCPDPVAAGIPTEGEPILIDISLSTTAAGQCLRAAKAGGRLPGPWLIDGKGNPTDNPVPLVERREGGLLPLGGVDLGYKGFALALIVEAMTSALAGQGRANGEARWGCSVFLLLIDPERFGGRTAFVREMSALSAAVRSASVPAGAQPVRLPGERALRARADQLAHGVRLHPDVLLALDPWARKFRVTMPSALG